jgi:hypothetical protein
MDTDLILLPGNRTTPFAKINKTTNSAEPRVTAAVGAKKVVSNYE